MTIYEILKKYRRNRRGFEKTEEYEFFSKNRDVLNKMTRFDFLFNHETIEFDIIRANIIIQAYFNKQTIEAEIKAIIKQMDENKFDKRKMLSILKDKIVDLPYLIVDKTKIYVPLFNVAMNVIYTKHPEKLLTYPYNQLEKEFAEFIIDTFDTYGVSLYDSYFTRLVKISSSNNQTAFFNYDTYTIYIVNDQGRLDVEICLFDKFIKKPIDNHMLERLRPVVEAYFNNDKDDFILKLRENNFISDKLLNIIRHDYEARNV